MSTIFICLLVLLFCSKGCISTKGTASKVLQNSRMLCTTEKPSTYIASSQMQCVHKCLKKEGCKTINYKQLLKSEVSQHNCEIHLNTINSPSCSVSNDARWETIIVEVDEQSAGYESCKDVYENNGMVSNGVYKLKSGKHYCIMSPLGECGSGGWTLAMKINGSKHTFSAGSSYWTNEDSYNSENGIKSLQYGEAKFPIFNSTSYQSLCIGMKFAGVTKWIQIHHHDTSLLQTFKQGAYKATTLGKAKWRSLISGSSMQQYCNREGFNVKNTQNKLYGRVALISNQENQCHSPDSFLGLGLTDTVLCNGGPPFKPSCGNYASCSPDNGDRSASAFCYLLIK